MLSWQVTTILYVKTLFKSLTKLPIQLGLSKRLAFNTAVHQKKAPKPNKPQVRVKPVKLILNIRLH